MFIRSTLLLNREKAYYILPIKMSTHITFKMKKEPCRIKVLDKRMYVITCICIKKYIMSYTSIIIFFYLLYSIFSLKNITSVKAIPKDIPKLLEKIFNKSILEGLSM